jgi:hypothetical protein
MISLGSKVRDIVTGFSGILVARTEWCYGCVRYGITREKLDKEGKPLETQWFDEQQVEVIERTKPAISKQSRATSGGPMPLDPGRR